MLAKATDIIPTVNRAMVALARFGKRRDAQKVLNKARKHSYITQIWMLLRDFKADG